MTRKNQNRKLYLLISLLFFTSGVCCRKGPGEEKYFRFIDQLSEKSIIDTPLVDLDRKFQGHTQRLDTEMADFTEILGEKNLQVTAYSTEYPVLAFDDKIPPGNLEIRKNGNLLNFLKHDSSDKEGWKWIKAEKTIFIKKWFYRVEQITGKTFYGTDIILPSGDVMFEILTTNSHPEQFAPELEVSLDGKVVGSTKVDHRRQHVIFGHTNLGIHKLRLILKQPGDLSMLKQEQIEIFVGRLRIKCLSDILLLYEIKSPTHRSSTATFTASYLKEPITKATENGRTSLRLNEPSLGNLYTLYKLNDSRTSLIHDYGVGLNPKNLKKKLEIGENSINTIFAPAPSTYVFETKIPERGVLQFGFGLLSANRRTAGKAGFRVIIEHAKKKETVFSSFLQEKGKIPQLLLDQKISLEKYEGKKVKIFLVTQNLPDNIEEEQPPFHYAFWYNPLLFQKIDGDSNITNLILISLDTLRADHLGLSGYARETSPNLDKLLDDSVMFSHCYSTSPSTLRAHMSLLTGLDPIRHQVYTQQDKLNPEVPTLADILRINGFTSTAFTGGARVSAVFGFDKGFDRYNENKSSWLEKDTPEELLAKSLEWLRKNRDKNHFLFLHTYQPHDPYANSSEYGQLFIKTEHPWKKIELFKHLSQIESPLPFPFIPLDDRLRENIVALYDGEIRYTDENLIKPLIAGLKDLNLYDNTMLIITSDHGEEFYEHGMWMHGGQLYNELIRVPLIIKFPHSKHSGKKIEGNVSLIDIVPTVLKEMGITYADHDFDGKDVSPLISDKTDLQRDCFSEIPVKGNLGKISVVHRDFKLIWNRIIHKDQFEDQAPPEELELYNLQEDPSEKNNLAASEEELVEYLMAKIGEYLKREPKAKLRGKEKPVIDEDLRKRLKALGYIE